MTTTPKVVYDVRVRTMDGKEHMLSFHALHIAANYVDMCIPEMGGISITSRKVAPVYTFEESVEHWRFQGFPLKEATILALAKHASTPEVKLACIEAVLAYNWAKRSELV